MDPEEGVADAAWASWRGSASRLVSADAGGALSQVGASGPEAVSSPGSASLGSKAARSSASNSSAGSSSAASNSRGSSWAASPPLAGPPPKPCAAAGLRVPGGSAATAPAACASSSSHRKGARRSRSVSAASMNSIATPGSAPGGAASCADCARTPRAATPRRRTRAAAAARRPETRGDLRASVPSGVTPPLHGPIGLRGRSLVARAAETWPLGGGRDPLPRRVPVPQEPGRGSLRAACTRAANRRS
jgi:hypothetical protein